MLIWINLITSWVTQQERHEPIQHQPCEKKNMISAKPAAIAKTTAVHVAAAQHPDQTNVDSTVDEKPSAKIALSVELAKQQQHAAQKRLSSLRAQSILSKASVESLPRLMMKHHQADDNSIYKQQQWNYSAKALPDTFSTRVSANGSVALSDSKDTAEESSAVAEEEPIAHSPAVTRLILQHRQAALLSETASSSSSESMTKSGATMDQHRIMDTTAARGKVPCDNPSTYDEGASVVETITDTSSMAPAKSITSATPTTTRNPVLPVFEARFTPTTSHEQRPEPIYAMGSIIGTTFSSFSSLFNQKDPEPGSWTSMLQAKLSKMVSSHPKMDTPTHVNKKIAVVGIHGWFPTKLVRSMIGEPTGTSQKFCKQMVAALEQYLASEHQLSLSNDSVTVIPLEGEGKVEERISMLYHQLVSNLEWLEAISSADIILWGTHSQGTPVSVMLLHQLLQRGHVHVRRQSICLLAMAGIGHGPFPSLQGSLIVKYFEADAARELFEFMDSNSAISQKFRESLGSILDQGIKMVLVGSLQDQVVPLYSAILTGISHPNILRAVYIDKHIYTNDDFLINLVVFALRLRNAGIPDHGLFVHVSEVLAGSIYALEGGHSTIYEEIDVYHLAVQYLFDTPAFIPSSSLTVPSSSQSLYSPPPESQPKGEAQMDPFKAKLRLNPYYLPWVLRGLFEDPLINKVEWASSELSRLHELFMAWTPTSTRLREFKFRLEPLKEHIFAR